MDFERKSRLRRAVPTLGPAGRLVGEESNAFESVPWDGIRGRLQGARVIGAGHPVAAVAAAVQEALKLHGGNLTAAGEPRLDLHQHRVAAAVRVENFLPGQSDLHRTSGGDGELGGDELVRKDVALAAESSAIRRRDHADAAHRQVQHLAQCAVHVMRCLRRSAERELAVGGILGDGGVLLHREVGIALEEDDVFSHVLGGADGSIGIAELQGHGFVHVRQAMDRLALAGEGLLNRHEMRQFRELHVDQVQRLVGDPLISGGHRRDWIAHIPDFLPGERLLVLADREDPELDRQVVSGQDGQHSGQFSRA